MELNQDKHTVQVVMLNVAPFVKDKQYRADAPKNKNHKFGMVNGQVPKSVLNVVGMQWKIKEDGLKLNSGYLVDQIHKVLYAI